MIDRRWVFVVPGKDEFAVIIEGVMEDPDRGKEPYYDLVADGFATRADAERFIAEKLDLVFRAWVEAYGE